MHLQSDDEVRKIHSGIAPCSCLHMCRSCLCQNSRIANWIGLAVFLLPMSNYRQSDRRTTCVDTI